MIIGRSFLRGLVNACGLWLNLLKGTFVYLGTGRTPQSAYQSMIQLFCKTRGLSNDLLHGVVRFFRKPYKLASATGVLGRLENSEVQAIGGELRQKGYYVFPVRLPDELCDRLVQFARGVPARPCGGDGPVEPRVYDPNQPAAPRLLFAEQDLVGSQDVQKLIADYSILAVAQAYLGCQPVLDLVTMWWSTTYQKRACSESAQLYHFDMDRIKWLKFFFYLTDVTPEHGPHCFVAGSHQRRAQPRELLNRGYARISDEEIACHYPRESFLEFTGPRGTIIAEDTRGFHKGKLPETGDRLILEFEFSDCLFGANSPTVRFPTEAVQAMRDMAAQYPRLFSRYAKQAA